MNRIFSTANKNTTKLLLRNLHKMSQKSQPCFFYNTGGCFNSDGTPKHESKCKYSHIHVDEPLERPQDLLKPCNYYHLTGYCVNAYCQYGHVELSKHKWHKFYPDIPYIGTGYSHNCVWNTALPSQLPALLSTTLYTPIIHTVQRDNVSKIRDTFLQTFLHSNIQTRDMYTNPAQQCG